MSHKTVVHVFDVDGTLTKSDSLLLLMQFERPNVWKRFLLILSVLPEIPTAIFKNEIVRIKQALLKKLWFGKKQTEIETVGQLFFAKQLQKDLRPNALAYLEQLRQTEPDSKLVLLSASCREWLAPMADLLGADLICTELEYDVLNNFTGVFATPNCKGPEKVRRLLEKYPVEDFEFICYADDTSDRPLQSISRQFFYRYF